MLSSFVWSDYLGKRDDTIEASDDVADDDEINDQEGKAPIAYSLAGLKGRARKDKARAAGIVAIPRFEHVCNNDPHHREGSSSDDDACMIDCIASSLYIYMIIGTEIVDRSWYYPKVLKYTRSSTYSMVCWSSRA